MEMYQSVHSMVVGKQTIISRETNSENHELKMHSKILTDVWT